MEEPKTKSWKVQGLMGELEEHSIVQAEFSDGFRVFLKEEQSSFCDWINGHMQNIESVSHLLPLNDDGDDLYQKIDDGIILCELINMAEPGTIEDRAINKARNGKMSFMEKHENLTLAINSAKSIGIHTINMDSHVLSKGDSRKHIILGLIWQILKKYLVAGITLQNFPGLSILLSDGETIEDFLKLLSTEEVLIRWVNYQLGKANCDRKISNFGNDIKDSVVYVNLINQIAPSGSGVDKLGLQKSNLRERAEETLKQAEKIDCREFVTPNAIVEGAEKLNMAFVANMFNKHPALEEPELDLGNQETSEDKKYGFTKKLELKKHGYTRKQVKLQCKVNDPDARVEWYKDGKPVSKSDFKILIESDKGVQTFTIKEAELEHAGKYTCKIEELGKEGDNETSCDITIGELLHKFAIKLETKQDRLDYIEGDIVEFKLECEEDDAEVKWFKDGVEIIPDGKRIQIVQQGKRRKLVIDGVKKEDAGKITAKTNADETSCDLGVKPFETMDGSSDGHLHGTLTIKVIEAKDLPDTDTNFWNIRSKDLTDPFVRGDFGTEMLFQTKHIDDELNPHWGETHYARINDSAKCLVISVLDKNFIFPSFVGYVSFSTEDIVKEEIIGGPEGDWFPLFNDGKQQGKIKLSIQFTPKDPFEDEFHLLHGRIQICINEARDLPDMDKTILCKDVTDPFVHGDIGEARLFKTDHKDNQLNPIWNESFNVHVCHYAKTLDIMVEDKDWNDNEFVGSVSFSTKKLLNEELIGGPKGDWFPIWKDGKSCGEIKISMKFTSKEALKDEQGLEVKDAYFPLRDNCKFTLYQEAECPPESLSIFEGVTFPDGSPYQPTRCWYDLYQAIKNAKKFIYIAGWSVNTEIELVRGQDDPDKLSNVGRLLKAKADEGVKVILMVWDDKTSDGLNVLFPNGEMMTHAEATRNYFEGTKVNCVLVGRTKTFGLKSDQITSSLYSHHQKSVTCDVEDTDTGLRRVVSFIGGLDITHGRYDTPEFPLFKTLTNGNVHYGDFHGSNCPGATRETGPRQPWHDNHARVEGIAANDIKQNFEDRILKQALEVSESLYNIHEDEFVASDSLPIVPNNEGGLWSLQLFRSISSDSCVFDRLRRACLKGKGDRLVDNSIQRCMIQQIRNAQNFIYMETQSFLGSAFQWESEDDDHMTLAHNLIPVEISRKIIEKIKQGKMFTAYIVISMFPEGDPTAAPLQEILYWQYRTIQSMYRTIAEAIKETNFGARPEDFLKFFCLGKRESKEDLPDLQDPEEGSLPARIRETLRQPVYVHSKVTIIDDQYILVGSANVNERSLSGERDTEIAMGGFQNKHTVALEGNPRGDVHTYRMALWASHFGGHQDAFENPNTPESRGKVTQISEQFWQDYVSDDPQHCNVHMLPYPIDVDPDSGNVTSLDAPWDCFPDTTAKVLGQKSVFCGYPVKLTT